MILVAAMADGQMTSLVCHELSFDRRRFHYDQTLFLEEENSRMGGSRLKSNPYNVDCSCVVVDVSSVYERRLGNHIC